MTKESLEKYFNENDDKYVRFCVSKRNPEDDIDYEFPIVKREVIQFENDEDGCIVEIKITYKTRWELKSFTLYWEFLTPQTEKSIFDKYLERDEEYYESLEGSYFDEN